MQHLSLPRRLPTCSGAALATLEIPLAWSSESRRLLPCFGFDVGRKEVLILVEPYDRKVPPKPKWSFTSPSGAGFSSLLKNKPHTTEGQTTIRRKRGRETTQMFRLTRWIRQNPQSLNGVIWCL